MIPESTLLKVIDSGLAQGADFCEVYAEETRNAHTILKDSKLDFCEGLDSGIGIRLFYGKKSLYTYTNDSDESSLIKAVKRLSQTAKQAPKTSRKPFKPPVFSFKPPQQKKREFFPLIKFLDGESRHLSPLVSQCVINFKEVTKIVQVANSEGILSYDLRPYHMLSVNAVAEGNGEKETGQASLGCTEESPSFFNREELKKLACKAGNLALLNLKAEPAPAGRFPVIINKGFGGVIFHEACGHGLESTAVAENASVFADKLGRKIASDCVTAWDDGTIAGAYGFLKTDDEGRPAQKTLLIEKGILKNFMVDDLGSRKTGYRKTGSARRQSYHYPPTSRMRNTFIAPQDSTLEEMIKDIDNGLFAKSLGGGSVTPGTSAYNFSVIEGFWIKNGRIEKPVKGASLVGNGLETLSRIKKVGKDLELSPGTCGSVSGFVPVTVGQPPILVSELTLGGQVSLKGSMMS